MTYFCQDDIIPRFKRYNSLSIAHNSDIRVLWLVALDGQEAGSFISREQLRDVFLTW